jgi:hypothetical protein
MMSLQQVIVRDEMEMRPGNEGRAAALKALAGVVVIALMSLILMATGGDDAKKHAQKEVEARRQSFPKP